ncbi:MAG TPA: methyltransferase domain-containing protein [Acidimicrobiia bacterium]|nr:methyltransferase domain-containing protein [Acidimicrobiia bacterium]
MTDDLMFKDEIQHLVRAAYEIEASPDGPGARFYSEDQLSGVPPEARSWMLGVGNPLPYADLRPGETVVDLGCGAGVDAMLAARATGPEGRVVGVDFLGSMVDRAAALASEAKIDNVEFVQSEIEDLPLADGSVDVVVSNSSINLSARKSRVFAEAYRVLRPGGRLCVTDLTLDEDDLPPEILTHPSAWAG